ncbi:MFS transporter [Azospirillum sp. TSA6c]|uniref:MFS transporter n=1 Tax=unclassified Azospirillum TaxID=2630922 RepID=UPI0018EEC716|nr:MFS transporter [Azospirillum sp. TSA6c]
MSQATRPAAPTALTPDERRITLVIAAVQFINILDFMMVMPLGPDFARALGIPAAHIGYIGGSYTAAAAVAGLIGSMLLDRFDRRRALAVAMAGLIVSTALGGLAWDFPSLLAARVLAGLFGGPAVAVAIATLTDRVAPQRRGQAMGAVMSAFSLSAIAGVPVGLELALYGGWRLPFFAVAAAGLVVAVAAIAILPPQRGHLAAGAGAGVKTGAWVRMTALLSRRKVWLAYATVALVQVQQFMIVPNIAAYVQGNLGFPRDHLSLVYMTGGTLSFFAARWAGRLVDRHGSSAITFAATVGLSVVIFTAFIGYRPWMPVLGLFPFFMTFVGVRMVANGAAFSRVPDPQERAGFMALVSAVQHLSSAFGAFLSAEILTNAPDGRLEHVSTMAVVSIAIGLAIPLLTLWLERATRPVVTPVPAQMVTDAVLDTVLDGGGRSR